MLYVVPEHYVGEFLVKFILLKTLYIGHRRFVLYITHEYTELH
jgi:hypothetical protein